LRAGIAVDTTARKIAENQLRQSEELYRKLSEQMLGEIKTAARVQRALIPHGAEFGALSVRTIFSPYQQVSGDLFGYDWIQNKQRFRGFIVDVTGHGISTAFHAAAMNVLFHQALDHETTLIESLRSINRQASVYFAEGSFAAAICFEFDFGSKVLRWISAGIPYFLLSTRTFEGWKDSAGSIIGVSDEPEFYEQSIPVGEGDTFYFMSDGLQEPAMKIDFGDLRDFGSVLNRLADIQRLPGVRDDVSALCIRINQI
jgi:serine phosphatase RsbU (regulator of sigma subunit)